MGSSNNSASEKLKDALRDQLPAHITVGEWENTKDTIRAIYDLIEGLNDRITALESRENDARPTRS